MHLTAANITCPNYIRGRLDASHGLPLCLSTETENNNESYISYCNGYASLKAVLDYEHNVLSNIITWPISSQDLYKQIMEINDHIY